MGAGRDDWRHRRAGHRRDSGGRAGRPDHDQQSGHGAEAQFDSVLRLPSRTVYAKVVHELTDQEKDRLLSLGRRLNPAEVWIFADSGPKIDMRLDPVFMAENRLRRGRIVSVSTADMLSELFGQRFAVTVQSSSTDVVSVTLKSV